MQKYSDGEKLEQLYDLYEQKMYAVAFSILHNEQQAEDVVQETFIKLLKNIKKIKEPSDARTRGFVFRMIKSTAIDQYRRNQRGNSLCQPIEDMEFKDQRDEIGELISYLARKTELEQVLSHLPTNYREVIIYRFVHQLSVKETATVLEIKEETVRKRQQRALKKIKEILGEVEYEYANE